MREINEHLKHIMGVKKDKRLENKETSIKIITWSSLGIVTIVVWTIIYNLIF